MPAQRAIDLEELRTYFRLPEKEVAKKLGICLTSLKKVCRHNGIFRWPYRKMKSLDKKMNKDGVEGAMASSPQEMCSSPSEMSHASTACSPSPDSEPEAANASESVELAALAASSEHVKISLSLSPEMLEQIDGGGQIRFAFDDLNHDYDDAGSLEHLNWQPATPATTVATKNDTPDGWGDSFLPAFFPHETTAVSDVPQPTAPTGDDADDAGMSDAELIAMLAGCAAAPAQDPDAGQSDVGAAEHSMVLFMDQDQVGACALQHFDEFENPLEAVQSLISDGDADHQRLWSEDLLGIC